MVDEQPIKYDAEMRARLWEHRETANQGFAFYAIFFVVAEAILLSTTSSLVGNSTVPREICYTMIALGIILTCVCVFNAGKGAIAAELDSGRM